MGAPKLKLVTTKDKDEPSVQYVLADSGLGAEWRKFGNQVGSTILTATSGLIITGVVLGSIVLGNWMLAKLMPYLNPPPSSTPVGREATALKDINIRRTPGIESSNMVGRCGQGANLKVLETNAPGNWYRVKIIKKVSLKKQLPCPDEGWVFTENLRFNSPRP